MIWVVLRKELTDHWRDRRSVMGALVLPVIGPLLLLLVFNLIGQQVADRELEVPVVGAEHAPQLIAFLRRVDAKIVDAPDDPVQAVIDGDVPMVLRIDADYSERLAQSRSAPVDILVDDANQKGQRDVRMLRHALMAYNQELTSQRLIVRGVAPEIARPLAVREVNVAAPERSAAQVLSIVPLMLLLVAFIGGMNIAIDATAGERERRSLEPLLLNPVARSTILLGKWLATSVFSLAVLLVALVGFMITIRVADTSDLGVTLSFGLEQALPALGTLAPLAILAAALQMLVATFARTFKEAQTYLSLFSLLPIAPALYLMLNPGNTETWMMLVPAMGQVAAITDVLGGDPIAPLHFVLIWASSAVYCAVCLGVLSRLLYREEIVFGR